ncbi:MAG TPA: DUF1045 domain-containing protein [Thermohalobaculum sp.]|nr:DUF1045 domain-containing protein [Thermohalobaculum sp.]
MLDDFARYAVYWVPRRPDPLAQFGAAWTGWCAERGEPCPRGSFDGHLAGLGVEVAAITRALRCHGLHGAIRAPFRLGPGRSRFSLEHVLDALAETMVAFPLPRFELAVLETRVALVPARSSGSLAALVTRVSDALAPLAAPAGTNGSAGHPPRAAAGDPALVPFRPAAERFHVPLTDALPIERAHAIRTALAPLVGPMLDAPRRLSELALMGDPGGGRPLRVLLRYGLADRLLRRGAQALPCHGPEVLTPMPDEPRRRADAAR